MSKFCISVTADTISELKAKVLELAQSYGADPAQMTLPLAGAPTPAAATEGEETGEKKQRVRRTKEQIAADEAAAAAAKAPAAPAAPAKTKAEATAAIVELNKAHGEKGVEVARKVLGKFGVERLSELDAAKYGELIAECQKAMPQKEAADSLL